MSRWLQRPATPVLLAIAAAACLVPSVLGAVTYGWPDAGALAFQLMLTIAGVLLWGNRESRGNAAMLVAAGALVGVSALQSSFPYAASGYWVQFGWTFSQCVAAVLAQVLLTYPRSRLEPRTGRALVAAVWVWALIPRLVGSLLWSPADDGWTGREAYWVTLYPANAATEALLDVAAWLMLPIAAWFALAQVERWRTARGAARTPVRIVAGAGLLLASGLMLQQTAPYAVEAGWAPPAAGSWVTLATNAVGATAAGALLVVAVRAATRRGAVMERLLATGGNPPAVQEALRTELVDPSLRLLFVIDGTWVDADGRPDPDRTADGARAGRVRRVLLEEAGVPLVEVDADGQVLADPAGLRLTLAATAVLLQNTRLTLERAAHLAEVEASRARIVEAGVAQRRELERDLHDGAQQSLLAVAATLSRASVTPGEDHMRAVVDDARGQLSAALGELRRLARGIHPAALSQGGLAAALTALAERAQEVDLHLSPEIAVGHRYPAAVESTAYFVAAEAVANALKHAAGAVVDLDVAIADDAVVVRVEDHGTGGARLVPGGGLTGLGDRVRALGGTLTIDSPPGSGTTLRAVLPLTPEDR